MTVYISFTPFVLTAFLTLFHRGLGGHHLSLLSGGIIQVPHPASHDTRGEAPQDSGVGVAPARPAPSLPG